MAENNNQNNGPINRFSKKQWVGVGIAILVVITLALLLRGRTNAPTVSDSESTSAQQPPAAEVAPKPATTVSYDQMLSIYKNRIVTVANNCAVTPEDQKLSMGTMLLINNTSDKTQVVGFGSDNYTISSKHYRTIKLVKDGRFIISCDGKPTHSAVTVVLK